RGSFADVPWARGEAGGDHIGRPYGPERQPHRLREPSQLRGGRSRDLRSQQSGPPGKSRSVEDVEVLRLPVVGVAGLDVEYFPAYLGPVEWPVMLGPVERVNVGRRQRPRQAVVVEPGLALVQARGEDDSA